jgi:hypothetical protein
MYVSVYLPVSVCLYVPLGVCVCVCACTHMQRSENSLREPVLSCLVGLRDRTQVSKLGGKCLYPLSHPTGPSLNVRCYERVEGNDSFSSNDANI